MGRDVPTPATLGRIIRLCWLAATDAERFKQLEREDSDRLNRDADLMDKRHPIDIVRTSHSRAALSGLSAVAAGALVGFLTDHFLTPGKIASIIFGCVGAAILLWATIALVGWKIQTYGGVTLSERVNRWYFGLLYWVGTFLLIVAAMCS